MLVLKRASEGKQTRTRAFAKLPESNDYILILVKPLTVCQAGPVWLGEPRRHP